MQFVSFIPLSDTLFEKNRIDIAFFTESSTCWSDGTLLEVVNITLPCLPSNDKGLLPELINAWVRCSHGQPDFWTFSDAVIAKVVCERGFDKWQSVFVSNPEFTLPLFRKMMVDNAMKVRAIKMEVDGLRTLLSTHRVSGALSEKKCRALKDPLDKIMSM